jgi:hypothetical protein
LNSAAFAERQGDSFIFDVQTHYHVSAGYDPADAEGRRRGAVTKDAHWDCAAVRETGLNPRLSADRGTLDDLSWQNFIKEVFFDSETSIGLISTPPGPYPVKRSAANGDGPHQRRWSKVVISRALKRMLAHGLATPQLGAADLDSWPCRPSN